MNAIASLGHCISFAYCRVCCTFPRSKDPISLAPRLHREVKYDYIKPWFPLGENITLTLRDVWLNGLLLSRNPDLIDGDHRLFSGSGFRRIGDLFPDYLRRDSIGPNGCTHTPPCYISRFLPTINFKSGILLSTSGIRVLCKRTVFYRNISSTKCPRLTAASPYLGYAVAVE